MPENNKYKVTLRVNDKSHVTNGDSVFEAIKKQKIPELEMIKTKGIITAERNGASATRAITIPQFKKMLVNETWMAIQAKLLESGLK